MIRSVLTRAVIIGVAALSISALTGATSAAVAAAPATVPPDTTPAETLPIDPALAEIFEQLPAWLTDPANVPEDAFDPAFLAEVPITDVRVGLASLGGGEWTVSDIQPITPLYATAIVSGPAGDLLADVELGDDGRIIRIFFENAGLREPPASMDELLGQLTDAGERVGFVVAEVTDGECVASVDVAADELLPIASTFKLYVLGALATAIADGTITWDQPVTIEADLRSPWVPFELADGDTMTVQDLAQIMIEVSDNTATDHLMALVGRDAVEATLIDFGHHDPAVTLPLLTTREMSILKTDPDLLARYAAADETERRELLTTEVAAAPMPDEADVWTEPRSVFEVEWFATPNDLCRAMSRLLTLSAQAGLEPLGAIMTANTGIIPDASRVVDLWFKGGSEPGVLVGAWLAQRTDGTWFVAAGGVASSTAAIDPAVIELVGAAVNLS